MNIDKNIQNVIALALITSLVSFSFRQAFPVASPDRYSLHGKFLRLDRQTGEVCLVKYKENSSQEEFDHSGFVIDCRAYFSF